MMLMTELDRFEFLQSTYSTYSTYVYHDRKCSITSYHVDDELHSGVKKHLED